MPHVVLSGKYDFTRIYIEFKKKINKIKSSTIIKYDDSFINNDKNLILIKTIVIENQQAESFYIMIMQKEQQLIIAYSLSNYHTLIEHSNLVYKLRDNSCQ